MWSIFTYIISFLIVTLTTVYLYFKNSYKHWRNERVPFLEPVFPFGNLKPLMLLQKTFGENFSDLYKEFKSRHLRFGGYYNIKKPTLMLIDPELIKTVVTTKFAHFHDRGIFVDEENDPLTGNLVGLKGQRWKTLRAKLTPTFTSGKMKMMFSTIVECSKELSKLLDEHIKKREAIDVKDVFGRLTTDIIGSVAFGLDCNSMKDPNVDFRVYGKKIFEFSFKDSILNAIGDNFPNFLRYWKIPITPIEVTNFYTNIVTQTVEYREANNIHRKDFMDLLIRLKNNENILDIEPSTMNGGKEEESKGVEGGITFNEMVAQAFVFFAAGFETSSSALNFCMYELAVHQDIQEKLRQEIIHVLNEHKGSLTYEAIMEMKYMDKVLQESMRKYPPIPILNRECAQDFPIPDSDYVIKKGTDIMISTLGLQRDPDYYPDPDQFDPERFSEEEKLKRHPFTYLPFGEGPRVCIGMRFAQLQMKIILATVLKDYKFTLDSKSMDPIVFDPKSIFLSSLKPICLQVTKIQN